MTPVLSYGMVVPPGPRHLDLTPLTAIVVALLVARFVVGFRLTPMTGVNAAFAGALWAYLAEVWGLAIPTAIAVIVSVVLRARVHSARAARGGG